MKIRLLTTVFFLETRNLAMMNPLMIGLLTIGTLLMCYFPYSQAKDQNFSLTIFRLALFLIFSKEVQSAKIAPLLSSFYATICSYSKKH